MKKGNLRHTVGMGLTGLLWMVSRESENGKNAGSLVVYRPDVICYDICHLICYIKNNNTEYLL